MQLATGRLGRLWDILRSRNSKTQKQMQMFKIGLSQKFFDFMRLIAGDLINVPVAFGCAVGWGFGSRLEACSLSATRCHQGVALKSSGISDFLKLTSDSIAASIEGLQPPNTFTIVSPGVTYGRLMLNPAT